jgi:hypothetical protein
MRILTATPLLMAGLAFTGRAHAAETVTYTYDAKGRLVQSAHAGSVNNGVSTSYTHDKADNRTNVTSTAPCVIQALDRVSRVVVGYYSSESYYILQTVGGCSGVVLNYSTQNGTAASGVNYTATSGSLTLGANPSTQGIQINNVGLQNSDPKYFYINISSTSPGVTITDSQSRIDLYAD